jgi:DNA-binding MurR/RpiR family transcriptional regulator
MVKEGIFERIRSKLGVFSDSHKKIAHFFMENYERASRMNSRDIARELKLSPATVVRFATALEYPGFTEMLRELQETAFRIVRGPMRSLRESIIQNEPLEGLLSKVVRHAADGLGLDSFAQMNEAFIRTVQRMIGAERIFLVAARSSFCVVHYGAYMLGSASKNVFCLSSSAEDRYDRMEDLSERDVVIAVSHHSYYKDTITMAQYAKKSGAFVAGMTDSVFSPLVPSCDEVLILPNKCPFTSYVADMAVMDALILAFTQARSRQVQDILERRTRILRENGAYVDYDGKGATQPEQERKC